MEAVASDACFGEMPRQRKGLRDVCLAAMKRRVEAGDLWDMRRHVQDGADRRQVVRLMQRRQRYQLRQRRQHVAIQADWRGVMHPAMHDAMSDADHRRSLDQAARRRQQFARRRVMVEAVGGPGALGDHLRHRRR